MSVPLLVLENVEKRFGGLRAIAGVSLEVPERQIGRASCRERV